MKRSIMMFVAAMVIFSGLNGTVFGQGLQGERFFDITQITAPKGLPMALAKGIGDDGKMAMLSFLFPDRAQLLVGNEKKMVSIASYGVDKFFNPLIMTNSGDLVGDAKEGWNSSPAVIFTSKGESEWLKLTDFGQVISAKSDSSGKVLVFVNKNDVLMLYVASATNGVEKEVVVAGLSYYAYSGDGGISINDQLGVAYLIAPTSFSFGDSYFSFLSIFEIDLNTLTQNKNYIFGWDEETQYLANVSFGGVDGISMVGQYDDLPFVYNLTTGDLQTYMVGQDSESYAQAKGIYSDSWLTGELGSASMFFQHMEADAKIVVDFPFDYMTILTVKGGKIVAKVGDSEFYLLTLKSNARH
jgi:hypothetical protein